MTEPAFVAEAPPEAWLTPAASARSASASFLADLGHEIPTALLPSFLTATLGAPAAALGLIEGFADGFAGAARLAGGALADDPHRRRSVALGGYSATAVLTALIGLDDGRLAGGRCSAPAAGSRAGCACRRATRCSPTSCPREAYGRAYGFERAMDNLGAIGGPLLALGLVARLGARRDPAQRHPGAARRRSRSSSRSGRRRSASDREREPIRLRVRPVMQGRLGRLLVGVGAFELGERRRDAADPARHRSAHARARPRAASRSRSCLYTAYNVAATLASLPGGHLGDRRGNAAACSSLGVAASRSPTPASPSPAPSIALSPPLRRAGFGIGFVETAEHAAVAPLAPDDMRGTAFGLLAAIQSARQPRRQRGRRAALDARLTARRVPLPRRLDGRVGNRARTGTSLTKASGSSGLGFLLAEDVAQRGEGLGHDAEVGPAAALLALDEAGVEEHLEVVADGRLAEAERLGQVADARLAAGWAWIRLSSRSRAGSAITFSALASRSASSWSSGSCEERRAGGGDRRDRLHVGILADIDIDSNR